MADPLTLAGSGEQRLQAFLARNGYPGPKPAKKLRAGASGRAEELEPIARRQVVLALVASLEPIVQRISELMIEIRHHLEAHPDWQTFRSLFMPRLGAMRRHDACRDR